jgi:putative membrane protein
MNEDSGIRKVRNRRVHMANERTFLAWIRTSMAVMAFGFVVERFAIS